MSIDEDTELRDLLTQTLESNGSFAKIRAQLRASIFLALDEDETLQKKEPLMNTKLKTTLSTEEGKIMFCIVREFLEYFDLDFTLAVYDPESYLGSHYQYKDKEQIVKDLSIPNLIPELNTPILLQIINFCKYKNEKNSIDNKKLIDTPILDNKQEINLENTNNSIKDNSNIKEVNGNTTFDVNSPMFNKDNKENEVISTSIEISEMESVDKNKNKEALHSTFQIEKSPEQSVISDLEVSPPIVKESKPKFESKEKLKLTQKVDKTKPRNNLCSLTDLPPISVNKSRTNEMLLPPLYTKEFKEMNSQKDLEKIFDLESLDNYEEDFMSESEIDLVLNKDVQEDSKNDLVDGRNNLVDERTKSSVNTARGDSEDGKINATDQNSSVSSSDFDFNSNIDDILTSC